MRRLADIGACRRGVAAMEFALVLPLMVLVLVGIAELGNALLLDRKITRAAHIGADLVNQEDTVTAADITDIREAMEAILLPFPFDARDNKSGLSVPAGTDRLDGPQAVAYVRSRQYEEFQDGQWVAVDQGDIGRTARQQAVSLPRWYLAAGALITLICAILGARTLLWVWDRVVVG